MLLHKTNNHNYSHMYTYILAKKSPRISNVSIMHISRFMQTPESEGRNRCWYNLQICHDTVMGIGTQCSRNDAGTMKEVWVNHSKRH